MKIREFEFPEPYSFLSGDHFETAMIHKIDACTRLRDNLGSVAEYIDRKCTLVDKLPAAIYPWLSYTEYVSALQRNPLCIPTAASHEEDDWNSYLSLTYEYYGHPLLGSYTWSSCPTTSFFWDVGLWSSSFDRLMHDDFAVGIRDAKSCFGCCEYRHKSKDSVLIGFVADYWLASSFKQQQQQPLHVSIGAEGVYESGSSDG